VAFAREAGCLACDLIADTARLPGGRLHESSRWVVEHTIGPLGLGTLVVKPFRHVVHVADLDETESAELGPLLQQTAAAVTQVVAPEQVYTCLCSHAGAVPVHIHFVVQPITRSDMTRFDALGPDLQAAMFRADTRPHETEIERICEQFRSVFGLHR
jgi:diadenosine tetraphosphate (Ap4A) HIT family hydrolase